MDDFRPTLSMHTLVRLQSKLWSTSSQIEYLTYKHLIIKISKCEVVVFLCWQHIWGCSLPSMLPLQCKLCLKINGVIVGRTSSTILVHLRDPIWACPYTKTCIQPRYYILSQLCQNWTHLSSKKKKVFYGLCEARKNFHAFLSLGAFQWTWNLHTTCWCEGHINTLSLTYFMISHLYVQNDFITKTSKRSKYFTN